MTDTRRQASLRHEEATLPQWGVLYRHEEASLPQWGSCAFVAAHDQVARSNQHLDKALVQICQRAQIWLVRTCAHGAFAAAPIKGPTAHGVVAQSRFAGSHIHPKKERKRERKPQARAVTCTSMLMMGCMRMGSALAKPCLKARIEAVLKACGQRDAFLVFCFFKTPEL